MRSSGVIATCSSRRRRTRSSTLTSGPTDGPCCAVVPDFEVLQSPLSWRRHQRWQRQHKLECHSNSARAWRAARSSGRAHSRLRWHSGNLSAQIIDECAGKSSGTARSLAASPRALSVGHVRSPTQTHKHRAALHAPMRWGGEVESPCRPFLRKKGNGRGPTWSLALWTLALRALVALALDAGAGCPLARPEQSISRKLRTQQDSTHAFTLGNLGSYLLMSLAAISPIAAVSASRASNR